MREVVYFRNPSRELISVVPVEPVVFELTFPEPPNIPRRLEKSKPPVDCCSCAGLLFRADPAATETPLNSAGAMLLKRLVTWPALIPVSAGMEF